MLEITIVYMKNLHFKTKNCKLILNFNKSKFEIILFNEKLN